MKKEQREIYNKLLGLLTPGYGLCNICRFALWEGACETADLTCLCGIENIEENADDVWQGSDCWAFRPLWSLEDIADMVGLRLQRKHPDMSKCKDFIKGIKV